MESLLQDIRYALRTVIKSPGFTVVAILALTIGIGANTALFSVVNAILLRPLPYPQADQLVVIQEKTPTMAAMAVAYPNFLDYRERNSVFAPVVAYRPHGLALTGVREPERLDNYEVSQGFFETLGVQPLYGRTFREDEDKPGAAPVVVIGYEIWQRHFHADPNTLNSLITLGDTGYTVIGVMPQSFRFPSLAQSWTAIGRTPPSLQDRGVHEGLSVLARLKPGVTIQQAQADMDGIANHLAEQYKQTNEGVGVTATLLGESIVRDVRPSLLVLLGAVGFILLIACANVANLLLARAAARQKEVAIRTALGASHRRLIRQLLTESLLLALAGGILGILLAYWGIGILKAITPVNGDIPRVDEIAIDGRVLLFTFVVAILTGVVFGLAPARQAVKRDLNEALKEGGRTGSQAALRNRLRSALVVAEVAMALVVLIGGGLMLQGFFKLISIDPGFNAQDVVVMNLAIPPNRYPGGEPQKAFYQELLKRLQNLPDLQQVGVVSPLPVTGTSNQTSSLQEGVPMARENIVTSDFLVTSADYFKAMGVPLLQGRTFSDFDTDAATRVIIVDEMTARRFWPDQDPIGKRMAFELEESRDGPPRPIWREVVGVVGHVKHYGLTNESRQQIYVSYQQMPNMFRGILQPMSLVLRTNAGSRQVADKVRQEVWALDHDLPVYNVNTMRQVLAQTYGKTRLAAVLMGTLAVVGLLLAAIGLFGVMSHSVAQRTQEIGIRMALGAQRGQVMRMVMGQGMKLTILGLLLGGVAAFLLTPVLKSLLVGIGASDPVTYISLSLLLIVVALTACYLPARRATRVDPLIALRDE